jgi:hypothetical protein
MASNTAAYPQAVVVRLSPRRWGVAYMGFVEHREGSDPVVGYVLDEAHTLASEQAATEQVIAEQNRGTR